MSASDLIDELKLEHKAIFQLLDEVLDLGVESKVGRDKLITAQDLFMTHLHKEDKHVHAVLAEEEKRNPELRETMYLMHFNLRDVTNDVEKFFKKYTEEGNLDEFHEDFELINVALSELNVGNSHIPVVSCQVWRTGDGTPKIQQAYSRVGG